MHTGTAAAAAVETGMSACVDCPEHVLSLIRTSLSEKAA